MVTLEEKIEFVKKNLDKYIVHKDGMTCEDCDKFEDYLSDIIVDEWGEWVTKQEARDALWYLATKRHFEEFIKNFLRSEFNERIGMVKTNDPGMELFIKNAIQKQLTDMTVCQAPINYYELPGNEIICKRLHDLCKYMYITKLNRNLYFIFDLYLDDVKNGPLRNIEIDAGDYVNMHSKFRKELGNLKLYE